MTVATATNRNEFTGNGSIVAFDYTFVAYVNDNIKVEVNDVEQTSGFTVVRNSNSVGGRITFMTAPASGANVLIRREVPLTQTLDLVRFGRFPAESIERALDEGVMIDQQLAEGLENERERTQEQIDGERAFITSEIMRVLGLTLNLSGGNNTMAQSINMGGFPITNVGAPVSNDDVLRLSDLPRFSGTTTSHQQLLDRNGVGAHDDIYRRETTAAQIATGVFNVGRRLIITDRQNALAVIQSGSTADNYGTLPAGPGKIARIQRPDRVIDVRTYGAVCDGTTDDWAAINAALQTFQTVYIPANTAVGQTIRISQDQHLLLGTRVDLTMPTALTTSLEPVVWLLAPFGTVRGSGGIRSSRILKQSACPDGVIKLGMPNMQTSTNNCFQCEIRDLTVYGPNLLGQSVAGTSPDIGIHMPSPELQPTHFNYYHYIQNVGVEQVNIGIWLRGWANGNVIDRVYGVHIGNPTVQSALVLHQGALDNNVTNLFFNNSPNTTCVQVEDLDNRANGSPQVMQAQHNSYRGIVSEQTGTNELALDIRASRSSIFEVRDNVTAGNSLFAGFRTDNNTLLSSRTVSLPLDTNGVRFDASSRINIQRATAGDSTQEGISLGEGVTNSITSDNDTSLLLNRINGGGRLQDWRVNNANVGQIYSTGSGIISFTGPTAGIQLRSGFVGPCDVNGNLTNGAYNLATASGRFGTGFFTNNPDVSSDRNLKTDEDDLPPWLLAASLEIMRNTKCWRWLSKVEDKDDPMEGDKARYHVGPMAQDVVEILEKHAPPGTDVFQWAMVSKYEDKDGVERLSVKPQEITMAALAAVTKAMTGLLPPESVG